jgi:hypothetical protein
VVDLSDFTEALLHSMHRPTLLAGVLTILVICLYPPWAVISHDTAHTSRETAPAQALILSQEQRAATQIMHRAVFMPGRWTSSDGNRGYTAQIHRGRLLLQIVAAALIFGGLAYGIGPARLSEAEIRAKVRGYDRTL